MKPRGDDLLVLMPTLTAQRFPDGSLGLTTKFVDGVEEYLKYWSGRVQVLMEPSEKKSANLDNARFRLESLPFEVEIVDYTSPELGRHLEEAAIVHCAASHRQNRVADLCLSLCVPCVYGTEYSLRTRMQIVDSGTSSKLLRIRRYVWAAHQELRQRRAIEHAAGVQCNGTPTFDAYKRISPRPHLFFDTRTRRADLISETLLEARIERLMRGEKLRLAFTGRLARIKGAHILPAIADALRSRGVAFELAICGGGELVQSMESDIERLLLRDCVLMKGVLDFKAELVPFVKENVDLFVCTHLQGDPSCTYLETLACGVPIIGFDNEAFAGLMRRVDAGWLVPMNDVSVMAEQIAVLDATRHAIAKASRHARRFASEHTFEATFERRVEHLRECRSR